MARRQKKRPFPRRKVRRQRRAQASYRHGLKVAIGKLPGLPRKLSAPLNSTVNGRTEIAEATASALAAVPSGRPAKSPT